MSCSHPAPPRKARRRALPLAPLLALVLLAAGCGEETAQPGVRLRIVSSPEDGPVQGTVLLQGLGGPGARVYEARVLDTSEPDVYLAPDAPDDHYRVYTTAGWGMLWVAVPGAPAPLLRGAAHPPFPLRLGRPRTLYLGLAGDQGLQPGPEWGADWRPAGAPRDGPRIRIPIETEVQADGAVALRFRPEHWRAGAEVRIAGQFQGGQAAHLLALTLPGGARESLPHTALVRPAGHAPLWVRLVPPPGRAGVPDGTPVRVQPLAVPLDILYEAHAVGGRAQFDAVAVLGGGLRVTLPEAGPEVGFDLGDDAWRLRGGIHVVALDAAAATPVELGGEAAVAEVRALFSDGTAFGRLPFAAAPDGANSVLAPPGPQDWCVRLRNGSWVFLAFDVPGAPGALGRLTLPGPAVKGCRVSGAVRGGGVAHRVEFAFELPTVEAGPTSPGRPARLAAGEGFEAAVSSQGDYEASVPPGPYQIRVRGPGGAVGPVRAMELRPGMTLRMDLDAR